MSLVDLFSLLVPVTYLVFLGLEGLFPARRLPPQKGWHWLGLLFLVLMGVATTVTPLLLPVDWLARHRLVDGTRLGVIGGAVVGYACLSLVSFLWHRSAHALDPLWRGFHQLHHSPQRMDMSGALFFHPLEMVVFALIQVFVVTLVLGLDPIAAAATGYIAVFYSLFQHLNLRTPQWLGVLIQRPESHSLHHQRGVHAFNYADLPIWDMLAGTWRNPKDFEGEAGFDAPSDRRILSMLAFADVNAPAQGPGSLGQARAKEKGAPVARNALFEGDVGNA